MDEDVGAIEARAVTLYDTLESSAPIARAVVEDAEDIINTDATPAKNKAAAAEPQQNGGQGSYTVFVTQTMGQASDASPAPSPKVYSQAAAPQEGENSEDTTVATSDSGADSKPKPSTGGSKRGLSYEYEDVGLLKAFAGSKSSWVYNWASSTKDGVPSGMEYVPMLWGDKTDKTNDWETSAKKAIASGSKHLLSFNEPDHKNQSNIDPATAAAAHIQFMNPLSTDDIKIGGPAITNGEKEKGMGHEGWLEPFLQKCAGKCKIDFQPVHWYDSYDNMAYFKKYLKEAHDVAKKPLWITEFRATGSPSQQVQFMKEALPYLDSLDYVERYAYFMVKAGEMMDGNGVGETGQAYM